MYLRGLEEGWLSRALTELLRGRSLFVGGVSPAQLTYWRDVAIEWVCFSRLGWLSLSTDVVDPIEVLFGVKPE